MCLSYFITWIKAWTGFYKDRFSPIRWQWSLLDLNADLGVFTEDRKFNSRPQLIHMKNERDKQEIKWAQCIKLTQTDILKWSGAISNQNFVNCTVWLHKYPVMSNMYLTDLVSLKSKGKILKQWILGLSMFIKDELIGDTKAKKKKWENRKAVFRLWYQKQQQRTMAWSDSRQSHWI